MFSSLGKSLTSLLPKGPKALLASYLASALAAYFDVDRDKIESNLLKDARIVLRDARLRPQRYRQGGAVVTTMGTVDEVVFSWRWFGGDPSSAPGGSVGASSGGGLIQDAALTIKGLNFSLLMEFWDGSEELPTAGTDTSEPFDQCAKEDSEADERSQGYLQRYLQQIVDHLTLRISDFGITVRLFPPKERGSKDLAIIFGGESLQLVSLGRLADANAAMQTKEDEHIHALEQKITFGSIYANVICGSGDKCPLIEPIAYQAKVSRLTGRRFVDGIFSGLEVLGELSDPAEGEGKDGNIIFHAGMVQIQALCLFGEMIAAPEDEIFDDAVSDVPDDPTLPSGVRGGNMNTIFTLPMRSLAVILPNDIHICVPSSTVTYKTDGTIFSLHGGNGAGILIDDSIFMELPGFGRWFVDFIGLSVTIQDLSATSSTHNSNQAASESELSLATVDCKLELLARLLVGFNLITSSRFVSDLSTSFEKTHPGPGPSIKGENGPLTPASWILAAQGMINMRLEGTQPDKNWIQVSVNSPSIAISNEGSSGGFCPRSFFCIGMSAGPTSCGSLSIRVPSVNQDKAGNFCCKGSISISADSLSVIQSLQDLLFQFLNIMPSEELPVRQSSASPALSVSIPEISLALNEPKAHIVSSNVQLTGPKLRCGNLRYNEAAGGGSMASASEIMARLMPGGAVEVDIGKVESARMPGVVRLSVPVPNVKLCYQGGTLNFEAASVQAKLLNNEVGACREQSINSSSVSDLLPFPVRLSFEELGLELPNGSSDSLLCVRHIDLSVRCVASTLSIEAEGKVSAKVEVSSTGWLEATMDSPSIRLSQTKTPQSGFSINQMRCGGVNIGPCSFGHLDVRVPSMKLLPSKEGICINEPVELVFGSAEVAKGIGGLWSEVVCLMGLAGTPLEPTEPTQAILPFPLDVAGVKVTLVELNTMVIAKNMRLRGSDLLCDCVEYAVFEGPKVSVTHVEANVAPHAMAAIVSIDEAHFPGVVCVSHPARNVKLRYQGNALQVQAASVQAEMLQNDRDNMSSDVVSLPFPVDLVLGEFTLASPSGTTALSLYRINIGIRSIGSTLSIAARGTIAAQVKKSSSRWLKASFDSPSLAFSGGISPTQGHTLHQMGCAGVNIGPCSSGNLSAHIPSMSLLSGEKGLCINGVEFSLESTTVGEEIHELFSEFFCEAASDATSLGPSVPYLLPFPLHVSEAKIALSEADANVLAKNLFLRGSDFLCDCVHLGKIGGPVMSVKDLKANLHKLTAVASIDRAHVPGTVRLLQPVSSIKLRFQGETLFVEATSVRAALLKTEKSDSKQNKCKTSNGVSLPFPVGLVLGELILVSPDGGDKTISFHRIDTSIRSDMSNLSIAVKGTIAAQVGSSSSGWVRASIESPSLVVSGNTPCTFRQLSCAGANIGPCSFGHLAVRIPSVALFPKEGLSVNEPIDVSLESRAVLDGIWSLCSDMLNAITLNTPASDRPTESSTMPFALKGSEIKITLLEPKAMVVLNHIKLQENDLRCGSLHCTESSGASASILDMKASGLQSDITVEIGTVLTLNIPNAITLSGPVSNVVLEFKDGVLWCAMHSVRASLLHGEPSTNKHAGAISVPFPVRLLLEEFRLEKASVRRALFIRNIDLDVRPMGSSCLSIQSFSDASLRLESSPHGEWVESSVKTFSLTLSDRYDLQSFRLDGATVGPSSFDNTSVVRVASVALSDERTKFIMNGTLEITVASLDSAKMLQNLVSPFLQLDAGPAPPTEMMVEIPKMVCSLMLPNVRVDADHIVASATEARCSSLQCVGSGGLSFSLSGFGATFAPNINIQCASVDYFLIPGFMYLAQPLLRTTITYGDALQVNMEVCDAVMATASTPKTPVQADAAPKADFSLPCPVHFMLHELRLRQPTDEAKIWVRLKHIDVHLEPETVVSLKEPESCTGPGVKITLRRVAEADHGMLSLRNLAASALIHPTRLNEIQGFKLAVDSVSVRAGFSSVEWSQLFSGDKKKSVQKEDVMLPFAQTSGLKLQVSFKGNVVSTKETTIHVEPFSGDMSTTLDDLVSHYTIKVLSRVPGLITNAEIFGANVVDSAGTNVGRFVARATVAGAAVGSVAGVAAVDGIKGAIASGKKSRGATVDDGYQFGDFTRGSIRSLREAAKSGAMKRRGDSCLYVPGDVIAGASSSASDYMKSNKLRLGAAGGGGAGMVAGGALLGPVGLIAGSYLGSKAGEKSLKDEDSISHQGRKSENVDTPRTTLSSQTQPVIPPVRTSGSILLPPSAAAGRMAADQDLLGLGTSAPDQPPGQSTKAGTNQDLLVFAAPSLGNTSSSQHGQTEQGKMGTAFPKSPDLLGPSVSSGCHSPRSTFVPAQKKNAIPSTAIHANQHKPNQRGYSASWNRDTDLLGLSNPGFGTVTSQPPPQTVQPNVSSGMSATGMQQMQTQPQTHRPKVPLAGQKNVQSGNTMYAQSQMNNSSRGQTLASTDGCFPGGPHKNEPPHSRPSVQSSGFSSVGTQPFPGVGGSMASRTQPSSSGYHTYDPRQAASNRHLLPGHHGGRFQQAAIGQNPVFGAPQQSPASQSQEGYKFGDLTRGVIARGKEKDGRDKNSGYKFGDFTKGLFG